MAPVRVRTSETYHSNLRQSPFGFLPSERYAIGSRSFAEQGADKPSPYPRAKPAKMQRWQHAVLPLPITFHRFSNRFSPLYSIQHSSRIPSLRPVDGEGQLVGDRGDRALVEDLAAADHGDAAGLAGGGHVDVVLVHGRGIEALAFEAEA